jgi:hypothetical protein
MLAKFGGLCAIGALLSMSAFASPITISYDLSQISGNNYLYVYSIYNNGSLGANVPIQLFDIFFDPTLYLESSLAIVTPNPTASQWTEYIFGSVAGTPADFDVSTNPGNPGIGVGSTVSGFAVQFTWLGTGTPGSQPFSITDPSNFTQPLQAGTTTPEPCTFWGVGLLLAYGARRMRKRSIRSAA